MNASLPRFLDLQLGLGHATYGYALAAVGIGLAAGQAGAGSVAARERGVGWIGGGLLAMALLVAAIAATADAPAFFVLLALVGAANGAMEVVFETVVQRGADPGERGRIFGLASTLMSVAMLGAVAAAPLVNRLGTPAETMLLAAAVLGVSGVGALVVSRRPSLRCAPAGAAA